MVVQLSQSAKNILDHYDVNDLLTRTIPQDYHIPNSVCLEIYKLKTKFDTSVILTLNDTALQVLKSYAGNYPDYAHNEILAYLIETVCDLSKIHTKDISEALNKYYEIARTNKMRLIKILDAYANSLYYPKEKELNGEIIQTEGLTEESLAYFLISSERKRIIKINNKRPGTKPYPVFFIFLYSSK